ncbi:hypothetical protein [Demequina muriae]|uniref:Uncharacterized protein n=1 Tax=Demequina muriae TaxID=3051664 RepID=A0ABT8GDL6_9MICO|nr:hypothetical protein [Demequina sp. EGI L300058]MDN4479439.1 hypothetical protein [Demequina sp. EGI L300058]
MTARSDHDSVGERETAPPPHAVPVCPVSLRMNEMAAMLNAELADHLLYDGFEIQRFDDAEHGTGMMAFLSRRADRTVDCYVEPGLRLDRRMYGIGGGLRSWNETVFDAASLDVAEDGVAVHVAFTDVDGHPIDIAIDDRDGTPRRRGALLAPVGAGIDRPVSLMLVWMPQFDLVRDVRDREPMIRIDGEVAAVGRLPGAGVHHRHLIKYAAGLRIVEFNRDLDAPATAGGPGSVELTQDGRAVSAVSATSGGSVAQVAFTPAFPDLRRVDAGDERAGEWRIGVDGRTLTGGTWTVAGAADRAEVHLIVTRRWRPRGLPWLMRVVTTVIPVFRRWPTSYAWRATMPSVDGAMRSRWERTRTEDGAQYRQATGS